jgi:hypothetical protein
MFSTNIRTYTNAILISALKELHFPNSISFFFRFCPPFSFTFHSVSSAAAFKSILGFLPPPPTSPAAAAGFPPSGGTLAAHRGQRGSATAISTYVRQAGHAAARIAGVAAGRFVSAGGERLRFPAEEDEDVVDADDVDDVADDAVSLPAAARSRAERTMSRVQTAAEVLVAAAAGVMLMSWLDSWTVGCRGVRNVLPDCKKSNKIKLSTLLKKFFFVVGKRSRRVTPVIKSNRQNKKNRDQTITIPNKIRFNQQQLSERKP